MAAENEKPGRRKGRPPKPITPSKSARSRLGMALRQQRENEGVSLAAFAVWSTYSEGHLSRVEHGDAAPSSELVECYETRFGTDGLLRSMYEDVLEEQRQDRLGRRGQGTLPRGSWGKEPAATLPGDRSEFLADLTVPDGSIVVPGEEVEKQWRLRNAGRVAWHGRLLERVGPASGPGVISSPRRVPIKDTEPGDTVDVTVALHAPALPGSAMAYWQMVHADGRPCFPDRYAQGIYVQLTVRVPAG